MNKLNIAELTVDDDNPLAVIVRDKLADAQTPGYQAEFAPGEAEFAGAFEEDALSEHDAMDSTEDVPAPEVATAHTVAGHVANN